MSLVTDLEDHIMLLKIQRRMLQANLALALENKDNKWRKEAKHALEFSRKEWGAK